MSTEVIFGTKKSQGLYYRTRKEIPENYWNLEIWFYVVYFKIKFNRTTEGIVTRDMFECRLCGEKFNVVK